jgi:anti-anti-sigma factor
VDAGLVQVSFSRRGPAGVIKAEGELTRATEFGFVTQAAAALAAFRGPVVFDLSGLEFIDSQGARALAALLGAAPGRASLSGCSPVVGRVLRATGCDLPQAPAAAAAAAAAAADKIAASPTALARAARAQARRSAADTSAVMSRLAATYARLALARRYRQPGKDAERGRLLALSGQAGELARRYQLNAPGGAG